MGRGRVAAGTVEHGKLEAKRASVQARYWTAPRCAWQQGPALEAAMRAAGQGARQQHCRAAAGEAGRRQLGGTPLATAREMALMSAP